MESKMKLAQQHAINRTSPKGGPFIGTCSLCGVTDLRISDATKYCENVRGLTEEEALLEAIEAPDEQG
jgi:hypothetical protein